MLEYLLAALALIIALALMFLLGRNQKGGRKTLIISTLSMIVVVLGITYGLLQSGENQLEDVLIYITVILSIYSLVVGIVYFIQSRKPQESRKPASTRKISLLGLLVGLSSVLMLISFPVIPAAPFLKVELSALVIFMTMIWFDFKTAVIVSLITNIVHFFMPGTTPPIIPFMDEMVNFLATMIFIMPTAIFLNKNQLNPNKKVNGILIYTIAGFIATTVLMVLYNQFINLPLIYNMQMSFKEVIAIFGLFNIIKWGLNAAVINLTWKRFYTFKPNM